MGQHVGMQDGCRVCKTYDYPGKKVCIVTILIMIANVQQTDRSARPSVQLYIQLFQHMVQLSAVHDDIALDIWKLSWLQMVNILADAIKEPGHSWT